MNSANRCSIPSARETFLFVGGVVRAALSKSITANDVTLKEENSFLKSLATITDHSEVDEAIVRVYSHIDDLLVDANEVGCEQSLKAVNTKTTHIDVLLAFLMATSSIPRDRIPFREIFYRNTRSRFETEVGLEETAEILDRLR